MSDSIDITVLVENTAYGRGLRGEHGLAYWSETDRRRILFDTGQSDLIGHNARELAVNLASVDDVVLSHGHYDHTGGLAMALSRADRPRVFMHPAALEGKFSRHADGTCHNIGMPRLSEADIRACAGAVIFTEQPTGIDESLIATGEIPRFNAHEDTGGAFFLDQACTRVDPIIDDQALLLETTHGLVILLGCAHAGVMNTMSYARRLFPNEPIRAIIGGMHLLSATDERLEATLAAFRELDVQLIAPAHCTGVRPTAMCFSRLPDRCVACNVGSRFTFD